MTVVEAVARTTPVPDASTAGAAQARVIRRRHVIYVEGYDPQGAKGYYRLFDALLDALPEDLAAARRGWASWRWIRRTSRTGTSKRRDRTGRS